MKLRFVLIATALLVWCVVEGRPQPGTVKKHNEDLDGIGDDLEDFLKHRDSNNNRNRESSRDANNVYGSRNIWSLGSGKPGSAASVQPSLMALFAAVSVGLLFARS